ncbi:MAG: MarR family transcriptional regulator [Clostridia bacterium]|nr:MarR family transcriptional regulator [Clostridia bacterium]
MLAFLTILNEVDMEISHEIKVVAHLLRREFETSEELAYADRMTGANSRLIGFLAHARGDVFQRDVETHFSVRRSTASLMVRALEEKGLIRREAVNSDARLKKLTLTEAGHRVHQVVDAALERIDRRATAGIPEEELEAFRRTLEKMRANLGSMDGSCGCSRDEAQNKGKETT